MPVILHQSRNVKDTFDNLRVLDLTGNKELPYGMKQLPDAAELLETAFQKIAPTWWALGTEMGREPTAIFSHTPSCAPNASDFGLMLAWSEIVRQSAARDDLTWLSAMTQVFRYLALIKGVQAGHVQDYGSMFLGCL